MNEVAVLEHSQTALDIRAQVNRIQEVMREVMQKGQHYGVVPGCGDKPTLLKPGAEKLMMTFRLAVEPDIEDLSDASARRYRVKTRVTHQVTGAYLGSGVGECSSDEDKYAWREAVCQEEFDAMDPSMRREKWKRGRPAPYLVQQVRTNPSDVANTILKMAKKRSLVDAVLTVTGASDIFTQDIEDMPEEIVSSGKSRTETPRTELCMPNFGPDAGKPVSQVSTEHLQTYLASAERSLADPKKANFLQKNTALRDALQAELAARNQLSPVTHHGEGAAAATHTGAAASESGAGGADTPPAAPDAPSEAFGLTNAIDHGSALDSASTLEALQRSWDEIVRDTSLTSPERKRLYGHYMSRLKQVKT